MINTHLKEAAQRPRVRANGLLNYLACWKLKKVIAPADGAEVVAECSPVAIESKRISDSNLLNLDDDDDDDEKKVSRDVCMKRP